MPREADMDLLRNGGANATGGRADAEVDPYRGNTDPTAQRGTGVLRSASEPALSSVASYDGGQGEVAVSSEELRAYATTFDSVRQALIKAREGLDAVAVGKQDGIRAGNFPTALELGRTVSEQAAGWAARIGKLEAMLADNQRQLTAFADRVENTDNATTLTAADLQRALASPASALASLFG